jgi:hypothetical protein
MQEQGRCSSPGRSRTRTDESLRGFCLYETDLEETRRLAESDPSSRRADGRRRHDLVDEARIAPVLMAYRVLDSSTIEGRRKLVVFELQAHAIRMNLDMERTA